MRALLTTLSLLVLPACFAVNGPAASECRDGQHLVRDATGWVCGDAPSRIAVPNACAPRTALTWTGTAWACVEIDAATLEGRRADDFVGANAPAADSRALGGVAAGELLDQGKFKPSVLPTGPGGAAILDDDGKLPRSMLPDAQLPAGLVVAWSGRDVPEGWIVADGRAYPREDPRYAALFRAIGVTYGSPDADPARFRVPDYRGRFLRGVDHGAGHDPEADDRYREQSGALVGDRVGTHQGGQVGLHVHRIPESSTGGTPGAIGVKDEPQHREGGASLDVYPAGVVGTGNARDAIDQPDVRRSGDTRPDNAAVVFIIKL